MSNSAPHNTSVANSVASYIHPSVAIYGDVRLAHGVSIWPNAVLRGDAEFIQVGEYSNVQDFCMIHVGYHSPTIIGAYCSITHHCTIHGCTIEDNCLIGINATVMDGAVIGANSVVAPHTLVREGQIIPPNSLVVGVPGKIAKTRNFLVDNKMNAWMYYLNALGFAKGEFRTWASAAYKEQADVQRRIFEQELVDASART